MTVTYEGDHSIFIGCEAHIIDESHELAWAEQHVVHNSFYKWIIGRYAEADKANANRQHFTMDNLKFGQPLLAHAPLNINHSPLIVGTFVASDIVYPTQTADDNEGGLNPFMETLSVFWHHYFEDEFDVVETAHKANRLFYSQECMPAEIGCGGEFGCGKYFEYGGRQNPNYCSHLNDPKSGVVKDLVRPHFSAGALIVPPIRPGWNMAEIKQISEVHKNDPDEVERLYQQISEEIPGAEPTEWEAVMNLIMAHSEEK